MVVKYHDIVDVEISIKEFDLPKRVGDAVKSVYQDELEVHFPEDSARECVDWFLINV
jgi:hypothetical protein